MAISYEDISGSNIDPDVFEKFAAKIENRNDVDKQVTTIVKNLAELSIYKVITFDEAYRLIAWLSDKQSLWELNCIKYSSVDARVHNIIDNTIKHSFGVKNDVVCGKCGKTMYVESVACEYETPVRKLYRCTCGEGKEIVI